MDKDKFISTEDRLFNLEEVSALRAYCDILRSLHDTTINLLNKYYGNN